MAFVRRQKKAAERKQKEKKLAENRYVCRCFFFFRQFFFFFVLFCKADSKLILFSLAHTRIILVNENSMNKRNKRHR
jgi:hypothetical protein